MPRQEIVRSSAWPRPTTAGGKAPNAPGLGGCLADTAFVAPCSAKAPPKYAAGRQKGPTSTRRLTLESTRRNQRGSEVASWAHGSDTRYVDFGSYSNDVSSLGNLSDIARCSAEIDGRPAIVVAARTRDGEYVAAAHWPTLAKSSLGQSSGDRCGRFGLVPPCAEEKPDSVASSRRRVVA